VTPNRTLEELKLTCFARFGIRNSSSQSHLRGIETLHDVGDAGFRFQSPNRTLEELKLCNGNGVVEVTRTPNRTLEELKRVLVAFGDEGDRTPNRTLEELKRRRC